MVARGDHVLTSVSWAVFSVGLILLVGCGARAATVRERPAPEGGWTSCGPDAVDPPGFMSGRCGGGRGYAGYEGTWRPFELRAGAQSEDAAESMLVLPGAVIYHFDVFVSDLVIGDGCAFAEATDGVASLPATIDVEGDLVFGACWSVPARARLDGRDVLVVTLPGASAQAYRRVADDERRAYERSLSAECARSVIRGVPPWERVVAAEWLRRAGVAETLDAASGILVDTWVALAACAPEPRLTHDVAEPSDLFTIAAQIEEAQGGPSAILNDAGPGAAPVAAWARRAAAEAEAVRSLEPGQSGLREFR